MPCTPTYYACPAPRREQDVTVPPDRTAEGALIEAWHAVGHKWVTRVRVTERKR